MNKKILWMLAASLILLPACRVWLFPEEFHFTGTLEVTEHNVGARVPGRITELFIDEGSSVKTGDVIATLDRYEQARKDYERAKKLFEKGGVSEQTLEEASLTLQDQQILSPVNGNVLVKIKEKGEVVSAGSPVAVIGDMSKRWVRIFVPEGQINRISLGDSAQIHFDGIGQSFRGRVIFIATRAEFTPRNVQTEEERVTQTFAVKVEIQDPPENLRPGVAADLKLKVK